MRIEFVTKDGKKTDGYLTKTERGAVEFMFGRCSACQSSRNIYRLDPLGNGIYGFLRCSGRNKGYVDYLRITA